MAKRANKNQDGMTVRDAIEADPAALAALATVSEVTEPPTLEDRVSALERLIGEKDSLILRQANAIALGVENAERLRVSREQVDKLDRLADEAKKAAASAKKRYESAVKDHFELEAEMDSPQGRLPFPPPEEPKAAKPEEAEEAEESWRTVILDTLNIPKGTIEKLFDANICTVGDISDYLKPNASGFVKRLTDIPGIGAAKAEAIEAALDAFWATQAPREPEAINAEILAGVREAEEWDADDEDDEDFDGSLDPEPEPEDAA